MKKRKPHLYPGLIWTGSRTPAQQQHFDKSTSIGRPIFSGLNFLGRFLLSTLPFLDRSQSIFQFVPQEKNMCICENHCQAGSTNNRLKRQRFPRDCECPCLHCLCWCSLQWRPIHTQQLRPLKSSPNTQIYSRIESIWIHQSTLQNVLYIEFQTNDLIVQNGMFFFFCVIKI